ncbi:contact-dependent growth inhibition system immunity protein [Psychrobacter sanguinis]|uniref:contact-dependent growth inhibition system immunity protein n=1 Tax=Psychrobacter sanguinis TaxID=861445 RepID=UPI00020C9B2D|nr:contact-dependent growth inhibition system immunity protein [Psychrobacter sanguinis]EGK15444.1 Sir2 family transcriptional regulator [Psychrobacter sp. 1501(2011)]MCD9151526.1 hypothetical protein [Psychrobacter sanguinis]
MLKTFAYIMECYFYQDWQSEFAQPKDVLLYFATKENPKIVHNLIADIEYILKNNLSQNIFKENHLNFDPLLEGYSSEKEWFEYAYIILSELSRE